MPGFDGTGPRGMGPMTGGGRGFCSPWGIGTAYRSYGMAPEVGYGYRAAWGFSPFAPTMTKEEELSWLKSQSQVMKGQLKQIETRIKQLGEKLGADSNK
jgi:hypothetical protein